MVRGGSLVRCVELRGQVKYFDGTLLLHQMAYLFLEMGLGSKISFVVGIAKFVHWVFNPLLNLLNFHGSHIFCDSLCLIVELCVFVHKRA